MPMSVPRSSSRPLFTALLTAAALAGCVDDPAALGTVEGELVGGTATTVRPEIGTMWNGIDGSCTATLIGPRTVLAAAHCTSPDYTSTGIGSGASFSFTDRNGMPQTYPIDRVHSFATRRYEMVPGTSFTTDVLIAHLTMAVPSTQAVPAALSIQEPYSGDLSTIFGFGCTDRTPGTGGGMKQFLTFTYPDATTALCWGDSGGPVVFGDQDDGGAIWGVNSDYRESWDYWEFDHWIDMFGDVPFYRKQIESVVRGWDGSLEQGVNRPGLDYDNRLVASAGTCAATCQGDGNCRAYTYVPEGSGGRCWLKSGAPEPVPGPGMTSGLPVRLETTTDRAGGDFTTLATASADVCAAECGRNPSCVAFTFQAGTCRLKSYAPATSYCGNCTSGVPRRRYEVGVNRPGYDVAALTVASTAECARRCAEDERCEAYTHTAAATSNCWLKDAVPNAGIQAGMTSGVRRGLETNTNRWGMDYRAFNHAPNPAICQATCARENECRSWTYVPPTSSNNDATCWLKSGVAAPSYAAGLVSGVKGLEMVN